MEIDGKTVLVTGGAAGIGYCIVRDLLRHGAKKIAILDLSDSNGESVAAELGIEFGKDRVVFLVCDVLGAAEFKESFQKVIDIVGTLDILINNAGIMDDAEWEIMVDVNYKGVVRGTLLGIDHMGKHKGGKGGTILNVASIAAVYPNAIAPIYSGTKTAVLGFSLALTNYYEKLGIRVLVMCPGLTTTALSARFMASKEHAMDILDEEMAAKEMIPLQEQPPEHVSAAVLELLEKGPHGTVYVCENNEPPFALEMPHYSTRKIALQGL